MFLSASPRRPTESGRSACTSPISDGASGLVKCRYLDRGHRTVLSHYRRRQIWGALGRSSTVSSQR
jgi:hypothetical protein